MRLPLDKEYIIIGDVHGCIDELKLLLAHQELETDENNLIKLTKENKDKAIVLLGDFIDKGNEEKIQESIEFIYKNYKHLNQHEQRFYLILGNHESMVYRYIMNDDSLKITPQSIKNKKKYYNTVALLEKNILLKEKFIELYHLCKPYFFYDYNKDFSITLTHAPCAEEYLRQEDEISSKKMVKCISRSSHPKLPLDELIPYTHTQAKDNKHYHIFGHLSQLDIRQYKNKICIDTSAIYGRELSCAIVKKDTLNFYSVPFLNKQKAGTQNYSKLFDF